MVTLTGGPHDGLSVVVNGASEKLGRIATKIGDQLAGYYVRQTDGAWTWSDKELTA